jgi:hypothetical protein
MYSAGKAGPVQQLLAPPAPPPAPTPAAQLAPPPQKAAAPPPPAAVAPPGPIQVSACSVTPSTVNVGGAATLSATIDRVAPAGGIAIAINANANGAQDTLRQPWPTSIFIPAGQQTGTLSLQTQKVAGNTASQITFGLRTGGNKECPTALAIR